jgi:hypothetical protein
MNGAPLSGSYLGPRGTDVSATRPSVDVQSVPRFTVVVVHEHAGIPLNRKKTQTEKPKAPNYYLNWWEVPVKEEPRR